VDLACRNYVPPNGIDQRFDQGSDSTLERFNVIGKLIDHHVHECEFYWHVSSVSRTSCTRPVKTVFAPRLRFLPKSSR
jgi:hypothetical protein